MVCSEQIKAARALLGWSAGELAKRSGVGATTLRRYEMLGGIPQGNINVLLKIQKTLEAAGICFTGDPLVNPGVTLNLEIRGTYLLEISSAQKIFALRRMQKMLV